MAKCQLVKPLHLIHWNGEDWVEVVWPEDGRYDIGYQLAMPTTGKNGSYMGLFESAKRRLKNQPAISGSR